ELGGVRLHEIRVHGPALRRGDRGLGVLTSYVGRPRGAREDLPLRVHERDADIAVRGGDAVELRHDLTADVDPAVAVEHQRAYGGGGGEHIPIRAPPPEPGGGKAGPTPGGGGEPRPAPGRGGRAAPLDAEA